MNEKFLKLAQELYGRCETGLKNHHIIYKRKHYMLDIIQSLTEHGRTYQVQNSSNSCSLKHESHYTE